jgi:predicted N-acetyltransferase YhbS
MAAKEIQFRAATADDATRVHQLIESAFRAEDSRPGWTVDMALARDFNLDIKHVVASTASQDRAILIACDEYDTLIACVEVSRRSEDLARLALLSVAACYQQCGIGRRTIAYGEEYVRRTWGAKTTGLNVLSTREELLKWYMRCGYVKTGELTTFKLPRPDGTHHDLVFVEMEKGLV